MEQMTPDELFLALGEEQQRRDQLLTELEITEYAIVFIEQLISKLN